MLDVELAWVSDLTQPKSTEIPPTALANISNVRLADVSQSTPSSAPMATSPHLEMALGNVTAHVQSIHRSLVFNIDHISGQTVVRVVDSNTHQVIRQMPSEEMMALAENQPSSTGTLLDEQV